MSLYSSDYLLAVEFNFYLCSGNCAPGQGDGVAVALGLPLLGFLLAAHNGPLVGDEVEAGQVLLSPGFGNFNQPVN